MAARKKTAAEAVETETAIQETTEDQKAADVQTDPEEKQEDQEEEEELSPIAKRYQGFYKKGFWTKKMLKNMVGKKITEREYEIITGEAYA